MRKIFIIVSILFPLLIWSQIDSGIIHYKIVHNDDFENSKLNFIYSDEDLRTFKELTSKLSLELKFNTERYSFNAITLPQYTEKQTKDALQYSKVDGYYTKINTETKVDHYKDDSQFGLIIIEFESKINWELINESKIIDGYKCFKAVATLVDYSFMKNPSSEVTAWYCPEIPINLGPKRLNGLPGLIFESNERNVTLRVSKISLNPKNQIEFNVPFKAKRISDIDYKKLIDVYMEEMNND